jgi:hypothetical protein
VTELRVSPDLALSLEAVTETFGILAVKRAGKSNAAVVMAEEMFDAGLPWVAIDPKGDWWGIRSSADGAGPGLPILVLGGLHGDVPLEATGGHLVADLVVDQRLTCVLDVSEMSKADQRRFLTDFADRLYKRNREPLHVFCEEADEYIPQMVRGDVARMVGAFEQLVKRGGFRGIGITLITQRSASLNKDVLTQIQTLFAMRTTSPQDRKAILAWVQQNALGAQLVDELPELDSGEAWVFSPHWLGTLMRIRFRRRRTYDSGATPKVGVKARPPARLAEVDIAALQKQMAATIEKAKADDPRELRRRIAELEKTINTIRVNAEPQTIEVEKVVEVSTVTEEDWTKLRTFAQGVLEAARLIAPIMQQVEGMVDEGTAIAARILGAQAVPYARAQNRKPNPTASNRAVPRPIPNTRQTAVAAAPAAQPHQNGSFSPSGSQQKILDALAWLEAVGISPASRPQVGMVAGIKHTGGHYANVVSSLRTAGAIDYMGPGMLALADAGRAIAQAPDAPLDSEALQDMLLRQLTGSQRKVVEVVIATYPENLSREELADRSGMNAGGGHFANVVSSLRTLGLVDYAGPGRVVGTEALWLP